MMPLLAQAGYRVLSYDLAGQYESADAGPERLVPARVRFDYALFVDDRPPEPGQAFRGVPVLGALGSHVSGRLQAALVLMAISRNIKHVPPSRLRFVRHRFTRTRRKAVYDVFDLMKHSPDLRSAVRRARVSKLVAAGEHDVWPLAICSASSSSGDAAARDVRPWPVLCDSMRILRTSDRSERAMAHTCVIGGPACNGQRPRRAASDE